MKMMCIMNSRINPPIIPVCLFYILTQNKSLQNDTKYCNENVRLDLKHRVGKEKTQEFEILTKYIYWRGACRGCVEIRNKRDK